MSNRTLAKGIVSCLALASSMLLIVSGLAKAGTEEEVRLVFQKFVTAQNAHDLKTVGEILEGSPHFL